LQRHGLLSQLVCIGQQRQALIEQGTMLGLGLRQSDLTAPKLDSVASAASCSSVICVLTLMAPHKKAIQNKELGIIG